MRNWEAVWATPETEVETAYKIKSGGGELCLFCKYYSKEWRKGIFPQRLSPLICVKKLIMQHKQMETKGKSGVFFFIHLLLMCILLNLEPWNGQWIFTKTLSKTENWSVTSTFCQQGQSSFWQNDGSLRWWHF